MFLKKSFSPGIVLLICLLMSFTANSATLGTATSDGAGRGQAVTFEKSEVNVGDILILKVKSGKVQRVNMGALHKKGMWVWFSEKGIAPEKKAGETIEYPIHKLNVIGSKIRSKSYSTMKIAVNGKDSFKNIPAVVEVSVRKPKSFAGEETGKNNIIFKWLYDYEGIPEARFSIKNHERYAGQMVRIYLIYSPDNALRADGLLKNGRLLDLDLFSDGNHMMAQSYEKYSTDLAFPEGFAKDRYFYQLFLTDSKGHLLEISDIVKYGYKK